MFDPTQALDSLLQQAGLRSGLFPPTSRYHAIGTAALTTADGRTILYLRRRWVPQPDRFATLQEHVVGEGDRLDHVAAKYLGDPEQFWRLCDANRALHPRELESVGRRIRITLPEAIPDATHG